MFSQLLNKQQCTYKKKPTCKFSSTCGYGCDTPRVLPDDEVQRRKFIKTINVPDTVCVKGVTIKLNYKQQNTISEALIYEKVKNYPSRKKYIKKAQNWINSVVEGKSDNYDVYGRFARFPDFQKHKMYSFNWPSSDELFGIGLMYYGRSSTFGVLNFHGHGN